MSQDGIGATLSWAPKESDGTTNYQCAPHQVISLHAISRDSFIQGCYNPWVAIVIWLGIGLMGDRPMQLTTLALYYTCLHIVFVSDMVRCK